MKIISRRRFIGFLGFFNTALVWPFSLFSRNTRIQDSITPQEIIKSLRDKKGLIKTVSYSISRKAVYVNTSLRKYSNPEMPHDMLLGVYSDNEKGNLKTIILSPTEKSPGGHGAKITTVYKDKFAYQKIESLDGSFRTEYHSHRLSSSEISALPSYLDDILAMPKDNLAELVKTEDMDGDQIYVIVQGDSKYWISKDKASVVKKEIYRNSKALLRVAEYKQFKEVPPGILLPTLIIDKHFSDNNIVGVEFTREIIDIKINEIMPDDTFYVEKEKYNG